MLHAIVHELHPTTRRVCRAARPIFATAQKLARQVDTSKRGRAKQALLVHDLAKLVDYFHQRDSVVAELTLVCEVEVLFCVVVLAHETLPRSVHFVTHEPHHYHWMEGESYLAR